MAWRPAKCLDVLRQQINAIAPNRNKASDGTRASDEHRARSPNSDHNEKYINGEWIVLAMDITHDPDDGCNAGKIAQALVDSRDRRIQYVIWNAQISNPDVQDWKWRPNKGHTQHFHISIKDDPHLFDDTSPWDIDGAPDVDREPVGQRFKGITATVFGGPEDKLSSGSGAYGILDWKKPQVALPYNFKLHQEPLPKVRLFYGDKSVIADVADVGPWNTHDPYWRTGTRPQAESGYDLGQTKWGRRKTNKAGIDITVAAADALGLPGTGVQRKDKIDWEFVDAVPAPTPPPIKPTPPSDPPEEVITPPVVVVPPITPPVLPSEPPHIDFDRLERLNSLDIQKLLTNLLSAKKNVEDCYQEIMIKMELNTPREIMEAVKSGKTAAQIAEERKGNPMSNTDVKKTELVDVKSPVESKINWTQIVAVGASIAVVFGLNIPAETQAMIVAGITAAQGLITVLFRTFGKQTALTTGKT